MMQAIKLPFVAPKKWLTTPDLCDRYGVDRSTIWRWVKTGKLAAPDRSLGHPRWPTLLIEERDRVRAEAVQ